MVKVPVNASNVMVPLPTAPLLGAAVKFFSMPLTVRPNDLNVKLSEANNYFDANKDHNIPSTPMTPLSPTSSMSNSVIYSSNNLNNLNSGCIQ